MGIRMTQEFGLTPRAQAAIAGLVAVTTDSTVRGMFPGETYPLFAYVAPDAELAALIARVTAAEAVLAAARAELAETARRKPPSFTEFVQQVVYSSGPCIFRALRDTGGDIVGESLWSEADLENA